MGRDRRKPVASLILELVLLVTAYVLERDLFGPLRSQPVPGDLVGIIWLQAAAWILIAACSLLFAYSVLVRARGDLGTSILVGVVGLFAWAITPLAYTPGVGDLIPSWLLRATSGVIGFVPVVAAWSLTVGGFGVVVALSARRSHRAA